MKKEIHLQSRTPQVKVHWNLARTNKAPLIYVDKAVSIIQQMKTGDEN